MTLPVTRADLAEAVAPLGTKAELADAVAPLATKADLADAVAPLATKADLADAVAPLATKADLADAVAPLATKAELADAVAPLATKAELADAVAPLATKAELSTLEVNMNASFMAVAVQMRLLGDGIQQQLRNLPEEVAKFNRGEREQITREIRLIDDKYADLPARVKKLEERSTPRAKRRKRAG